MRARRIGRAYRWASSRWVIRVAATVATGGAAGWACAWIGTPIPWMLGPLFAVAILRVAGVPLEAPQPLRYTGQWIIGTALGLYFTPAVLREVVGWWPLLVAGAVFAVFLGYLAGFALAPIARIDRTTAIFASVPGGAAEMSNLGERYGARTDRVAAAQSLRILIVVAVVPAAFALLDMHGSDVYVAGVRTFDPRGFAELMGLALAGGFAARAIGVPNAFILGPLAVVIPLTASGVELSSVPTPVSNLGQWLLGCALGVRFQPDFLRDAHRFVAGFVASVFLSIGVAGAFGLALAFAAGVPGPTLVLGTAPGGLAEMCITAKVMQFGVPLVTALHVTRLVVLLLATAPLYRWLRERHPALVGAPPR